MKKIKIKSLFIENFKGIKKRGICFGHSTKISGANATGKTSIFDAFTWLLFNKNSAGEEKFNIRPLDKDGKRIDNVEIKVVAVLDVDGKEVELSKVQKQNWVKHRGSENPTLEGNVNSFEIDGYPKTEADFKAYISTIVSEDLFKMLTNPADFVNRKWKDQRDILMRFVAGETDVELANRIGGFELLVGELEKAPSTDDIAKKFSKALTEWKAKQKEIPVRIDELQKAIVDVDVAEMELAKTELESKIAEINKASTDNKINDLMQEEMQLQFDMSAIQQTMNRAVTEERMRLERDVSDAEFLVKSLDRDISDAERQYARNKEHIAEYEEKKPEINKRWKENKDKAFDPTPYTFDESKWIFDENATVCSMCGQKLPEDKIKWLKENFADRKQAEKDRLAVAGRMANEKFIEEKRAVAERLTEEVNAIKAGIESLSSENTKLSAQIEELKAQWSVALANKTRLSKQLTEMPTQADYLANPEYCELKLKYDGVVAEIKRIKGNENDSQEKDIVLADLNSQLAEVNAKIAKAFGNAELEQRIEELQEEQVEVGQKVADQEQMLYLLEQFIKAKMLMVSQSINSKFKMVSWKLFEQQLNGGLKECCECTVNGIPFSTLNSGHRIVAGLDIISSLSELYEVEAPIFVDNAESVNEFNIPQMYNQMVLLSVSDSKEIVIC